MAKKKDGLNFNEKVFQKLTLPRQSRMNQTKWIALFAVCIFVDLSEMALEPLLDWAFGLGHVIVFGIDVFFALSFTSFLVWEGVTLTPPRLTSIFGAFWGDAIGGDLVATLWTIDAAYIWWSENREKILEKTGIAGNIALQVINAKNTVEGDTGGQGSPPMIPGIIDGNTVNLKDSSVSTGISAIKESL